jgi:hypothetical protein
VNYAVGTIRYTGIDAIPPAPNPQTDRFLSIRVVVNLYPRKDDCGGCNEQGCIAAGKTTAGFHSVDLKIGLGKDEYGNASGFLGMHDPLPSIFLSQRQDLTSQVGTNSEVIRADASDVVSSTADIRQVRTPNVLADIVATNGYKYDVRFYQTNNVSPNKTNGLWVPTGTAYKAVTVENPDTSSASNRLFVTEGEAGVTNITKYTWDNTNTWTFEPPGGLRKETLTRTWDAGQTVRTELHSILETNNVLVFQEQKKFNVFPWGEELVEHGLVGGVDRRGHGGRRRLR